MLVWLAVALQVAPLQIVAVRGEPSGAQYKLRLEADRDWAALPVHREGGLVIVATLAAVMGKDVVLPKPAPPVESLELKEAGDALELRLTLSSEVPFDLQRRGREVTIVLGATPTPVPVPAGISPELLALYQSLRPPSAAPAFDDMPTAEDLESEPTGIGLGPLRFQPAIVVGYAHNRTSIDQPAPVEDSYVHIQPQLGAHLSLFDGRVQGGYEPQIRMRSRFAKINRPSHEANLRAEIPLGGRIILQAGEHYTLSTLDAQEVDPGREYFFGLERFWRSDTWGGLRVEVGPRLRLVGRGGVNRVRFEDTSNSNFFDYDQKRAEGGLELQLTEMLNAEISYGYERVPPPRQRPIVESTARFGALAFRGSLSLLHVDVSVGYREQEAAGAAEGGRTFKGSTVAGRMVKELGRGSRLSLTGARNVYLSGFEQNAFYVGSSVQTALDAQLPWGLSGRVGGGYHWNAYPTVSAEIGEKRRDRLWGWTAGVSRPLTRWSYLRVDYAWDRRDSNVPGLNSENTVFLAQLGLGLFGPAPR